MKRRVTPILLTVLAAACGEAGPTAPTLSDVDTEGLATSADHGQAIRVTNNADAGPGSFRAAVEEANANASVSRIRFDDGIGTVSLASTVTYSGSQGLLIIGNGAVIDAGGVTADGFVITGGGDLTLRRITFQNAPEDGVYFDVPAGATGTLNVVLEWVTIQDNGRYGLHVDDQAGGEPGGADSPAGVDLLVRFSHILNNNNDLTPGVFDFDGIRIDEGGDGDLKGRVMHSRFEGNRADGLEMDETGSGHASLFVRHSHFDNNGNQVQIDDDPEDGFDVDEAGPGSVYLDVAHTTTLDNMDDGIDLDEDGEGTIVARVNHVDVSGSGNDGLVFTEDEFNQVGSGGIHAVIVNVIATRMGDRGLDSDEFGDGDIYLDIRNSTFDGNDSDGIRMEEFDGGDAKIFLRNTTVNENGDEGLQIAEEGAGTIWVSTQRVSVNNNDDSGMQLEEAEGGDLNVLLQNSKILENGGWGITAEQEAPGAGEILIRNSDVLDNADGEIENIGVTVG